MFTFGKVRTIGLAVAGAIALGGCGGYGYGGSSYGVSLGYGGGGYYDPWYDGYYGAGYGYGYPSYGWYDGFYYPGNGYYVFDRDGRRHRWNDSQRRYWEGRRSGQYRDARRDGDPRWRDGRPGQQQGAVPGRGWRGRDGRPPQSADGTVRPQRPQRSFSGRPGGDRPQATVPRGNTGGFDFSRLRNRERRGN